MLDRRARGIHTCTGAPRKGEHSCFQSKNAEKKIKKKKRKKYKLKKTKDNKQINRLEVSASSIECEI